MRKITEQKNTSTKETKLDQYNLNKAELLELERKQKEDSLVPMKEVQQKWTEVITTARTKLLGISSKAKQRLPDLDTNAVSCIDDIVREALEELSAA